MADITSHDIPLSADGKPRRHLSETLVMAAMCVVTVAFGAALYMQVGLTLWLTFIAALSLYVTLLTLHALVRRELLCIRQDHFTCQEFSLGLC